MATSPAPRPLTPVPNAPAKPVPVTKAQTGAEALIRCLEREGVEYVFGLSGGAAMPIFDALVDSEDQADPRPPRTGRDAHGGRLRPLDRQARRRAGDLGPGRRPTR